MINELATFGKMPLGCLFIITMFAYGGIMLSCAILKNYEASNNTLIFRIRIMFIVKKGELIHEKLLCFLQRRD